MTATAVKPAPSPTAAGGTRLQSLDGLRALSVVLVLLGHVSGTAGLRRIDLGIGDYAHLGVVVFFVISGFLITGLLITEHERHGDVSLKLFYYRRALRIFPPAYAYLLVAVALSAAGAFSLSSRDIVTGLTYTANYLPGRSWQVGHLWSLSVEEQFYLIWPAAFVCFGPRRSRWAALAMVVIAPAARIADHVFLIHTRLHDLEMFPMVADSLAIGCLLATSRRWLEEQWWYLWLFRPGVSALLLGVALVLNRYAGYTVVGVFGTSIVNACLAVLIHRSVFMPADRVGRALNWRPVAFVGTLSYSLYLWQQLFLNRHASAWMNAFPQNLALAIAAALASYLLLERTLLKFRGRLRR